jgi:parvulin-like peptidyl-prolyl isomerase
VEDKNEHSEKEVLFLKLKTLNEIIQNALFKQEAKKYKLSLDPDEFKTTMETIKTDYLDDSFQKTFKIQSISQLEWEDKLKNSLILKNLINEQVNSKVTVGEDVSKKYFEDHPEEFQKGEQVKALHINVATEEEARRLLKKIKSRQAKFTDMAVKHSLGPESVEGGNLGYFEARQMPAEFDGVFDLKLYGTSDVIQTPYGYHIFKVVDKRPARKMSYEESKKIIREKLLRIKQEEAFKDWVVDLKNKAVIKINYEAIENVQ